MIVWRQELEHQIRFTIRPGRAKATSMIVLTCTCLPVWGMIAERERWDDPAEFFSLYAEHLNSVGG